MKILGAWMIAWGIFSLMIGLIGLQVGWLFFLDEFGPVMGYVLKIGLILAGVWVWRSDGREYDADEDQTAPEGRRACIPVILSGTLIVGVVVYITASVVKEKRLENRIHRGAAPAAWAATSPKQWPDLVLLQKAKVAHHSSMEAGCACLVRIPTGEIVALTAGHLLGRAGGVTPGFTHRQFGGLDQKQLATLTSEITSWKLFLPDDERAAAKVTGLYGDAATFEENCDQILLRVSPDSAGYPATPLDVRLKPVSADEPLRVVALGLDRHGDLRQVTYSAKRVAGPFFSCTLERPADLEGCRGAPVVDKDGLLVGIVTGQSLLDLNDPSGYVRSFRGHALSELMPVLKAAVGQKGIAPPSQAKVIVRPAKKARAADDEEDSAQVIPKNGA